MFLIRVQKCSMILRAPKLPNVLNVSMCLRFEASHISHTPTRNINGQLKTVILTLWGRPASQTSPRHSSVVDLWLTGTTRHAVTEGGVGNLRVSLTGAHHPVEVRPPSATHGVLTEGWIVPRKLLKILHEKNTNVRECVCIRPKNQDISMRHCTCISYTYTSTCVHFEYNLVNQKGEEKKHK